MANAWAGAAAELKKNNKNSHLECASSKQVLLGHASIRKKKHFRACKVSYQPLVNLSSSIIRTSPVTKI